MKQPRRIEILQAEVDEDDQSFFRLLVNGHSIKSITIEPGLYSSEDMCFGPSLISLLPEFPAGEWNDGLVAKDPDNVPNAWHSTRVDYLNLKIGRKLRTGINEATSLAAFDGETVVLKFARFHWEIGHFESETMAYHWIDGHNIGPRFLDHLAENGRVIGILLERITGARHAGDEDVEICARVLSRLHGLGVRHGDTNRFDFPIRGETAVLIDFDTARGCEDKELLRQELEHLPGRVSDVSGRGGGGLLI